MDELIVRSLQGRATLAEEERLRAWRRESAANERRYASLRELWSLVGEAAAIGDAPVPNPGELIARAELTAELEPTPAVRTGQGPAQPAGWSLWARRAGLLAAAAGLAAVAFGVGLQMARDGVPPFLAESEIVTGAGEMTTLTLADGTSVRLGPESRLRLSETEDGRSAYLEGRAFFGVQSDSTRPFTVYTRRGEARVLGTRFEVRSEEASEEFRVLVVEGEVAVAAAGTEIRVQEGEISRSLGGAPPGAERVDNVFTYLDWLGDALVFQTTPLPRALSEIEGRYGLAVDLRDPALADLTVTATFTGQPVQDVVFVICEIANAPCLIENDTLHIGRNVSGPQPSLADR